MPISLRSFTDFILRSRLRAISIAFIITFIPLIGTISIILAGLMTLRKGAVEGFWVLIAATLPYFILLPFQPLPLGLWMIGIITSSNILTWCFAALFKRFGNCSLILEIATLIGIILITTAHVIKPDLESFWEKQLNTYLTQPLIHDEAQSSIPNFIQQFHASKSALLGQELEYKTPNNTDTSNQTVPEQTKETTEPELISFINTAKTYATGALIASLLLTALLQLFIARWWQTVLSNPDIFRQELYHVRLSHMTGLVFLTTIILSYLKIALALDLLPVLYLIFCIAGLSLVHYTCSKFKHLSWLWLFVFYSVLLCSWMVYHLPLGFQLVALVALLDVWLDWRERLDKKL